MGLHFKQDDWHKADIVAAVRKSGTSLRRLSSDNGYHPDALKFALHKPWPRAEQLIAHAIGVKPKEIWPSRYTQAGESNRSKGRPKQSTHKGKSISAAKSGKTHQRGLAA